MKNEKMVELEKRIVLIFAVLFAMLVSVSIGCATAAEWHVYPGQTIQTTINNADVGDTIYVHAGSYTENVVVNKSLTLKGVGMPEINGQIPDVHEYNLLLSDTQGDATFIDIGRVWVEKGILLSHEPMLIFSVEYYTTKNSRALRIYMDTDNDPATGYNLNGIGADYRVCPGGFLIGLPTAEKWKSESEKWISINCYRNYDLCRNCPEGADARYYIDFQDANFQLANATTIRLVFESFYGSAYPMTVDDVAPDSGYVQLDVQKWIAMSVEPAIAVKSDDCIIEGFKLTGSDKCGLLILSDNSQISNNTISNNRMGLIFKSSNNNIIDNNTIISNEWDGILVLEDSTNNTIKNNNVSDCGSGVCLYSSSNNLIYDNYFNNINNAYDDGNNIWNISKTAGTNVIGGPYIGGNYWNEYTGVDTDGDGLGDTMIPYDSSGDITNGGDWLPLFQAGEKLPVNNTKWYFGPSLNVARNGLDAIEYVNKIYAIGGWGGSTVLEVFDPISNSWTYLSPLPVGQEGLAAARVDDKIYTFGSYGWKDTVQIYDISNDKWSAGPNLPKGMYWETAESIGDMIYIIGGYSNGLELDTLYILDTATNTWSQGASMPKFAQIPSSAVYNGEIYVFPVNYKYDPSTDSWTPFTGPPSGHGYGSEAVTLENNIYLIGGNAGYIYEAYNTTEIYDPSTDSWITGPELNTWRYQFGATHVNGKIYVIGGNENATLEKTVEILNGEVLISNVSVTNITTNSATIIWDTNEPSNSVIKYGTESRNYTLQKYDSMNVTSHSVTLIGLLPNTTYYFVVNSTYQSGNSNESSERSFITLHSYAKRDAGVTSIITPASPTDLAAYLPPEYTDTDISDSVVLNVNVTDITPDTTDAAYSDITINIGKLDIETCKVFKTGIGFLPEVDDITSLQTVSGDPAFSRDRVNKTVTVRLYVGDPLLGVIPAAVEPSGFDTGKGTYPSIRGTHNGTIIPSRDINVSKMYTYPCAGTGGHSVSIKLYENETLIASGVWDGYGGDWHNITIGNETDAPYAMLLKGHRYNYTIVTGSYPQIIHATSKEVAGGSISCSSFVDANGKAYTGWIPAIRLE